MVRFTPWSLFSGRELTVQNCTRTGGWVRSRHGLESMEERKTSCPCQKLEPDHPARSPSLYRLSYPGTNIYRVFTNVLDDSGESEPMRNNTAQTKNLECNGIAAKVEWVSWAAISPARISKVLVSNPWRVLFPQKFRGAGVS